MFTPNRGVWSKGEVANQHLKEFIEISNGCDIDTN